LRFIWADKAAQNWRLRVMMVPGTGSFGGSLCVIDKTKSPRGGRGFWG